MRRSTNCEIERCLKKVSEGVETFEDIWHKLHNAINSNQKEKYEQDLKKEIKKLQRLRDQIKTWVASSDVKDKQVLTDNRKLIEMQMERFKIVEKETKTKAYSKEGLGAAAKMDPVTKEKGETINWLSHSIDDLNMQLDKFESELETIVAGSKKKKLDKEKNDRYEELKQWQDKHKFHIQRLERIMRMVDNDALPLDQIRKIKEDVEYYVDSNQDPDFEENEYLYDDLDLEDRGTGILATTPPENEELDKLSSTPTSTNSNSPSPSPSLTVNHSKDKSEDHERKRHKSQTEEKSKNSQISASTTTFSSSSSSISKVPNTPTKQVVSNATISNSISSNHLATPPTTTPPPQTPYAAAAGGQQSNCAVQGFLISEVKNQLNSSDQSSVSSSSNNSANSSLVQTSAANLTSVTTVSNNVSTANFVGNASSVAQQGMPRGTPSPLPMASMPVSSGTLITSLSSSAAASLAMISCSSSTATVNTTTTNSSSNMCISSVTPSASLPAAKSDLVVILNGPVNNTRPSLNKLQTPFQHLNPSPTADPTNRYISDSLSSLKSIAQQAVMSAGLENHIPTSDSVTPDNQVIFENATSTGSTTQAATQQHNVTSQESAMAPQTTTIHLNPILGVAPLGPSPLTKENYYQLTMLEAAFNHLPHPSDSERLRLYLPRNPCQTPSYYPQIPPQHADTVEFFQRLSTETLFFIFYYMEGTKAQYLAAKALKKQSWRFHTKYMMWFQRHEEPKTITEDYEQGTYIYFDYEKWGQRKKEGFTFEYRYLEDRDLN
ncbi:CCR4-NOT transcription complex subunit 3 isoform X2 [Octopus sinensis]|uniref:CCR4-NOT transcription complex subunit 3 n=1 Tax=Octopus sinensis TaxID=2607531 RepID=A0A7E6FRG7_9MOLL|nr:CCR4-NOT transcription complex subunit 3 isoform X2 [Octopus sinensis]